MNYKLIAYINGLLLLILAFIMFLTGLTGLAPGGSGGEEFFSATMVAAFFGGILVLSAWGEKYEDITIRSGYMLTVSSWLLICLFCALPLYWSDLDLSFTDAVFESVSGLTTTGATILTGLDKMPHDILLWRSMLHWMGGVGIVIMAMALLPILRIGGMSLFRREASDMAGKVTARLSTYIKMTVFLYSLITLVFMWLLFFAGMSPFDALNHAISAVATGGFSTHDQSVSYFNSATIETILIAGMVVGSLPFPLYVHAVFGNRRSFSITRYGQVVAFLRVLCVATLAVTLWNWSTNDMSFLYALRVSAFNITSVITTSGFMSADFATWGSFATGVFFLLYFIGGCAGSTTGSVKIFRWQLLFRGMYVQFIKNLSPHQVVGVRYGGHLVDENVMRSVRNFLFLYFLTFAFISLAVMACGVDFMTSIVAVAMALANAGIGLGEVIGPTQNLAALPSTVKWLLDAAMILGRLELFTVFALFIPQFWRR